MNSNEINKQCSAKMTRAKQYDAMLGHAAASIVVAVAYAT